MPCWQDEDGRRLLTEPWSGLPKGKKIDGAPTTKRLSFGPHNVAPLSLSLSLRKYICGFSHRIKNKQDVLRTGLSNFFP